MKCYKCDKEMPYHREGKCYECRHHPKTIPEKIIIGVTILGIVIIVFALPLLKLVAYIKILSH